MDRETPQEKAAGSIFEFFADLISATQSRAVLVGGYAIIANQIQRMTFDVDFMVTAQDRERIEPELLKAGYSVFNGTDAFVQYRSEKAGLRDVDLILTDTHTLDELVRLGKPVSIGGRLFTVPCVRHLIAMKLHSMSGNRRRELKDLPDIVHLMSVQGIDPSTDEIREMFRKYKVMDLYDRTVRAVELQNDTPR